MFPLQDLTPSRKVPLMVLLLIAINVGAFLFELSLSRHELRSFIYYYGVIPARFLALGDSEGPLSLDDPVLVSLFTSMFLHGGWIHLLGNMWFLWIFGNNVEGRLGHVRFLIFYLLSGLGASLVHIFSNIASTVPTIGASGAIAGVLGAYMVTFPRGRILTLVPFLLLLTVELPAVLVIGVWFLSQLFNGTAAIIDPRALSGGGVAWWAHIGGFIVGIFLMKMLQPPQRATWDFEGPQYGRYRDR